MSLLRFSFRSVPPAFNLLLPLFSLLIGTVAVEIDREGRASELGRCLLVCDVPFPERGRRPPPFDEYPWNADIACEFRKGIGGLLGAGDNGL